MPELPEVETTRRGITPHVKGKTIAHVVVRDSRLRWPIPKNLNRTLAGEKILDVQRRGKYLLLRTAKGTLIMHLGMSGSLRVIKHELEAGKHDHFDLVLSNGKALRLRDPRRFGAVLWTRDDPPRHKLLKDLGPEPLSNEFSGEYLHANSRKRKLAVKAFIMDSKIVVGVGNIYASEALFKAGIHPKRQAGRISLERYEKLAAAIREVLAKAIEAGGTTLRDFQNSEGEPGYFAQALNVYGRAGEACQVCGETVSLVTIAQRSTFFCKICQN